MALPAKIVDVNTATWSDHLNTSHKPVQKAGSSGSLNAAIPGTRTVGDSASNEAWGQRINVSLAGRKPFMAMIKIKKVGNPTDGVFVKLYDYLGISGLPGTLAATSLTVKATQLSTTSRAVRFHFLAPPTLVNAAVHIAVFRTGSYDASNYYQIDADDTATGSGFADSHLSGGSWSGNATNGLLSSINYVLPNWYTFGRGADNKLHCYMTSDAGQTWSEIDSADAPTMSSTSTLRSFFTHSQWVFQIVSSTQIGASIFDVTSDAWVGTSTITVAAVNTNVSGQAPVFGFHRDYTGGIDNVDFAIYQGATENNMGTPYRRIKLTKRGGSTYDVVGSTNTPNSTLPGNAVHYDLRSCLMDDFGNIYIFYTRSDDSNLYCRIWKINETFATILNPASATTSNSSAYPVGLGTSFFRSGENYVALPYVDGSNTKIIICKAGTDAETAGNWSSQTVVASAAEVTASNPASLIADNEAGGKLFCLRVRTDKTIGLSDDGGTGTWSAEADFRSGQTIAGISGGVLLNPAVLGMTYLNQAPATDELQHDHL